MYRHIPSSQFILYIARIDNVEFVCQTFDEAYNKVLETARGREIIEVEKSCKDNLPVNTLAKYDIVADKKDLLKYIFKYGFIHKYHFINCSISRDLFTYDAQKELVSYNTFTEVENAWKYRNNKNSYIVNK